MECEAVTAQVHFYLDDQLEPGQVADIQAHLRGCAACTEAYERQRAMNSVVRQHAHYHTAPRHLARAIRSNLRMLAEVERPRRRIAWGWFTSGAAFACAATLTISLTLFQLGPRGDAVDQELVAAHIRSLMANHLTDVLSSDQHTVKPWFDGKLDMSPPVVDLASAGFPLVGGRLDYVEQRSVVALVYRRDKHLINLFIWPAAGTAPLSVEARQGYNVLRWRKGGMSYAAVSDVNLGQLQDFQKLIATDTSGGD
jgi:mycothiol system anti-sigma-R factor